MTTTPPTSDRQALALWFTGPGIAELIAEPVPNPVSGQLTVRALSSLISAGTELSVFRGHVKGELGLETCAGTFEFPVKYAYSLVGQVMQTTAGSRFEEGEVVFVRHPHQTMFTIRSDSPLVVKLPESLTVDRAVFLHMLDVAITAHLDAPVRHGDVVVVYGQGLVGLFVGQIARRTAAKLVVVDPVVSRRETAIDCGADLAVDPSEALDAVADISNGRGADISYEASGAPSALQAAIESTAQEGTVVALSYFGSRQVSLSLAPEFHFRRLRVLSSQANPFRTDFESGWSWERLDETGLRILGEDWLTTPITLRTSFDRADQVHRELELSADALTAVLDYETVS